MRTTITLDDEPYRIASLYATSKGITLGRAIGELIQESQGTVRSRVRRARNGLPVVGSRGTRVTSGLVKRLEAEESE